MTPAAEQGLLERRQGAGNFVSRRIDKNFAKLSSFSEDMRARGRTPTSRWLSQTQGTVTPEEALKLALGPGTPVYRFKRLRYADGQPMAIETATITGFALPSIDAVGDSRVESPLGPTVGDSPLGSLISPVYEPTRAIPVRRPSLASDARTQPFSPLSRNP